MAAAVTQPMTTDPSQHRQELIERLDALRRNESFCDVTVSVKGKEFKAHIPVLAAASPFFLSLLESDMRESNEQLIRIELEEATAAVMEDVLKYIYTGNISVTEESGHNLIATADYLLMPGLKTAACDFLKKNVTPENCIFSYYFADKYQCQELKEKSRETINSHFSVVMETDDFLNLDVKQVMKWVASDDVIVRAEEEIFQGILKWVCHNNSEREINFPELLRQVRLHSLSHEFIFNELINEELITADNECLNFVLASMKEIVASSGTEQVSRSARKCLETHADVIFVCGGRKALCYLPQHNKWYQLADMVLEHGGHAIIQCKDKIYIFDNQHVGPGKLRVLEYYMPSTNTWGTVQTTILPDVESEEDIELFSSLSVMNGSIYAVGSFSEMMFVYNPCKNDWDFLDLPYYQHGCCCITFNRQFVYVIGGSSSLTDYGSTTVKKLNLQESSVEDVVAMNEARHNAFGAAMNGKIYVAGGLQKKDGNLRALNTCEVYDPSTDEWQLIPNLNVPRHSANMVCFNGVLFVVGGGLSAKQ